MAKESVKARQRKREALVAQYAEKRAALKAAGDYATGANHVLPTGGAAKMYPPLGVDSFGKWMQVQTCTREGLRTIKNTIENIAEIEQLPAHKNSVSIRYQV